MCKEFQRMAVRDQETLELHGPPILYLLALMFLTLHSFKMVLNNFSLPCYVIE